MNFKRGIKPKEALNIGQHSEIYITAIRKKIGSKLSYAEYSTLSPGEKYLFSIIELHKMEVITKFYIDPYHRHFCGKRKFWSERRAYNNTEIVNTGIYTVSSIKFHRAMDRRSPLIAINFESTVDDLEFYMECYPINLKRFARFF